MRKQSFFLALCIAALSASAQHNSKTATPHNNSRASVEAVMQKFHEAFKTGNVEAMKKLQASDYTVFGTDPKEMWTADQFNSLVQQSTKEQAISYSVDREEVYMPDNQTAVVVDQFTFPSISRSIPVRLHTVLSRKGNNWLVKLQSITLTPKNEDIPKINAALRQ